MRVRCVNVLHKLLVVRDNEVDGAIIEGTARVIASAQFLEAGV